jgi:hypothetical protein
MEPRQDIKSRVAQRVRKAVVWNIVKKTFDKVRRRFPAGNQAKLDHFRPDIFEYSNCWLELTLGRLMLRG